MLDDEPSTQLSSSPLALPAGGLARPTRLPLVTAALWFTCAVLQFWPLAEDLVGTDHLHDTLLAAMAVAPAFLVGVLHLFRQARWVLWLLLLLTIPLGLAYFLLLPGFVLLGFSLYGLIACGFGVVLSIWTAVATIVRITEQRAPRSAA